MRAGSGGPGGAGGNYLGGGGAFCLRISSSQELRLKPCWAIQVAVAAATEVGCSLILLMICYHVLRTRSERRKQGRGGNGDVYGGTGGDGGSGGPGGAGNVLDPHC